MIPLLVVAAKPPSPLLPPPPTAACFMLPTPLTTHHHVNPTPSLPSPPSTSPTTSNPSPDVSVCDQSAEADESWCLICYSSRISDRVVLPRCLHSQFCFGCILRWAAIKRTCPLCQSDIGKYVIHAIRDDDDYIRYHLPPPLDASTITTSNRVTSSGDRTSLVRQVQRARLSRHAHRHPHLHLPTEQDLDRQLEKRKHIYRHSLYAKHVGSNRHTGYRACPTPVQIRQSVATGGVDGADVARRISMFVTRELQVWPHIDVEFLTQYVVSLLQVLDVSADETVRLLGEFLGERKARHFLHELECFLRSGRRELRFYDNSPLLQYPSPSNRIVVQNAGGG